MLRVIPDRELLRVTSRWARCVTRPQAYWRRGTQHDFVFGRTAQERLIYIDDLFRFVIEEIDLRAHDAQAFQR